MKLKVIYGLAVLLFLGSCIQKNEKSYPDADAVYLKKVKTYRLNKDGSITTTEEKQQKLLTYRAFQSLFGDTHIYYNPDFQTVDVKSAFTVMADGKNVEVPQNGINDILPGWSAGSKAYNHLREKVITHTGLELNAVINCEWSVTTNKDIFPFLAGVETISGDCPIENYEVIVEVPEGINLNYQVLNSAVQPQIRQKDGFKIYNWKFSDVKQVLYESNVSNSTPSVPVLLFSTQNDEASVLKWLALSENVQGKTPEQALARIDKDIKNLSPVQKALKAREIVASEVNTLQIPATLTGYKSRTPGEVWQSNSATPFEKSDLLAAVLRSLGYDTEVCIKYPSYASEGHLPFYLLAEPLVKTVVEKDTLYLSATHQNKNAAEFRANQTVIRSLVGDFKRANTLQPALEVKINCELALTKSGQVKGNVHSEYSNYAVSWYSLLADRASIPDKQINSKARIEELSEKKLSLSSVIDSKTLATARGEYVFVAIPESNEASAGIISPVLFSARENSISLPYPINESYHIRLQLPKNARLIYPAKEEIPNSVGSVRIVFSQDGESVTVDKQLTIMRNEIKPDEYSAFKQLMDKWHTPKFKELVIGK